MTSSCDRAPGHPAATHSSWVASVVSISASSSASAEACRSTARSRRSSASGTMAAASPPRWITSYAPARSRPLSGCAVMTVRYRSPATDAGLPRARILAERRLPAGPLLRRCSGSAHDRDRPGWLLHVMATDLGQHFVLIISGMDGVQRSLRRSADRAGVGDVLLDAAQDCGDPERAGLLLRAAGTMADALAAGRSGIRPGRTGGSPNIDRP